MRSRNVVNSFKTRSKVSKCIDFRVIRLKTSMVWACDVKTGSLCRKEGDGNGCTRENEEMET